jgi:signal transduction histidine kinase/ActR/RegA family two-component response regulator
MALLLTSITGVAAIGMFVLQASWRASGALLTTMILPVVIHQASEGTRFGAYSAVGFAIFLAVILREAHRCEARILELLRLRFFTDRIAEERAAALRLAEQQSRVKSQFLATMSHEMRTPLHGILGVTRMLQEGEEAPAQEQLSLIERAGEHLLRLINDVLDVSKLEAGHLRLSPGPFDLRQLLEEVLSLSAPAAREAGLVLASRLRLREKCIVHGDAARVRQVLHNLVGNAIKFTEVGTVTVLAGYRRGRARITVEDTGVGISAEEVPRIFDAFHQADGSFSRRFGGTGLGLSIARELAHAMGGDLVCLRREGGGSRFTVTLSLPLAPEGAVPEETREPEPAPVARDAGRARASDRIPASGDRIPASGDRIPASGDRIPASGDRIPASGDAAPTPAPTRALARAEQTRAEGQPASRPTPTESAPARPLRQVLLAEDNPVNALVAQASLKKIGLSVRLVVNGAEAVAAFQEHRPDVVLLDCQMPIMDGFEAVGRMRQHEAQQGWERTPVLALTANALEGDRERSLAAGMDEHLAKPFRVDELRAVIERLMRSAPSDVAREHEGD